MRIYLLFVFTIFLVPLFGQDQVLRWEIEKKISDNDFNIVGAEKEGIVVFRETDKYEEGDKIWEFKFLNTELQLTQEFELILDHEFNLAGYDYQNGYFYLLFKDGMMNDSDWYVYRMNFATGEHIKIQMVNELEIELSHFLVTGDYMVLGGRIDSKPAIVHFSLSDKKTSVLPGFFRKEAELVDMKRNINGTFNVLFLDKEPNKDNNVLWLKIFSDTGELLLESSTVFEEDIRVHSGTTNELKGSDLIVVGTYGSKKSKLSNGLYFINIRPGSNSKIAFTDFTELNNFFQHHGDNREEKIKEKIQGAKGDKPYEYKATLMLWKVEEVAGNFMIFGELVDPQYQSNNRRMYYPNTYTGSPFYDDYFYNNSFNRRYYSNSHSLMNKDIMVSVEYLQNVLIAFDRNGKRIWDASQVIDDIETPILEQVSAYDYQGAEFQLMYKKEGNLHYTKGDKRGSILADTLVNIDTLDPMIDVKNDQERQGGVFHWYDDYYFVWGYQRIQDYAENERRTVFYINKIEM